MIAACTGSPVSSIAVQPGWGMKPCVHSPWVWGENNCADSEKTSWVVVRMISIMCSWIYFIPLLQRTLICVLLQKLHLQELQLSCCFSGVLQFKEINRPAGLKRVISATQQRKYCYFRIISAARASCSLKIEFVEIFGRLNSCIFSHLVHAQTVL